MTERGPAPTAPGMAGLPGGTAPVIRPPVNRRRSRPRALLAGVLAGLALAGAGGVAGSVLTAAEPPGSGLSQVAPSGQDATSSSVHAVQDAGPRSGDHGSGEREGEQD